jgi:hypothetical protein
MQNANVLYSSEGRSVLVLWDDDGEPVMVTESHPNYIRISQALANGDDPFAWMDDDPDWFNGYIEDEDFDLDDEEVGAVVENLSEVIERYRRLGMDASNLVKFMGRLSSNPSYRSREQLFTWAQAKDMTIDPDGYLIGYKGVDDDLLSLTAGKAVVNGTEVVGKIPNEIGSIVTMPRSEVDDNGDNGCSSGLHVGSWDYASTFGPVTVEVKIDPADVVSVPKDCSFQKMRVCRYEIMGVHESPEDNLTHHEPEATWDSDEAMQAFVDQVPQGWIASLKARLSRKGGS